MTTTLSSSSPDPGILARLAEVIESRRHGDPDKSYVARLFHKGADAILKKIGEEATETVMAAKDGDPVKLVHEVADLWFHSMLVLSAFGRQPADVLAELAHREGLSGLEEFAARGGEHRGGYRHFGAGPEGQRAAGGDLSQQAMTTTRTFEPGCIFCKIATGELPSRKVHEDEELIVFHDIAPWAPVHFLIVPKEHIGSLAHIDPHQHAGLLGRMLALAPSLAQAQGANNGFRIIINTGADGGQEVPHLHMHVIGGPRPWAKG